MRLFFCLLLGLTFGEGFAQFQEEVAALQAKYDTVWDSSRPTIVFTGSSSVRLWQDLPQRFPEHQILNTGFGGSQTSDLLRYLEELLLGYQPQKVFIYEGDNDIAAGKSPKTVLNDMRNMVDRIKKKDSTTQIVLISPKPSIARWNLKGRYRKLNRKLKRFSEKETGVSFANVWNPMLDGRKLKTDIFIADGLHMNAKGYDIWQHTLEPYLN
ncbi:MAG: GDSL-type esterase/lipase family protein [Bacteroidota bacterium]